MALVLNFHRAARINRRLQVFDLAVGVSLGIRDAFAKEGKLVQGWAKDLEELNPAPASGAADPLASWTKHLPVVKKRRKPHV